MSAAQWGQLLAELTPHLWAVALIAARLLPIFWLCPLFGGRIAPVQVRLGLTLSIAISIHAVGGVGLPVGAATMWSRWAIALKELLFGTALGLVGSLPFDAARMGGAFADLFRGTSAEAALPLVGTHEAASGNLLYELGVAVAIVGGALPLALEGIWRSYGLVGVGAATVGTGAALHVTNLVGGAMATGLAIGAPVAGATLAVDCLVGLVSRAAPQMQLPELGTPLKILGGGAVLWLTVGVVSNRVLSGALDAGGLFQALATMVR